MTTLMICFVSFVGVSALVGLVAFVLRDYGNPKIDDRLDVLIGKRREDAGTDILKRSAFESDKRSLLELITPNIPSLKRIFEQANCHIQPSTLFGIGLLLAVLGATGSWLARVPWFFAPLVGLVMFFIPLLWLLNKRRVRLKTFAGQLPDALELVARSLRAGQRLGGECTWWPRKCLRQSRRNLAAFTKSRIWAYPLRIRCAISASACPTSICDSLSPPWPFNARPGATWRKSSTKSAM